jgi:hypothetical protein
LVPKPDGDPPFRLIHDLSSSEVNDNMQHLFLKMDTAREAMDAIGDLDQDEILLAKVDVKAAYRLVCVAPNSIHLLGGRVADEFFVDRCLPFGARVSPALWWIVMDAIKSAVVQAVQRAVPGVLLATFYHGDDLLFIMRKCDAAVAAYQCILGTMAQLGVPLSAAKCLSPRRALTFLGLWFDLDARTVSVPRDKLERLAAAVAKAIGNKPQRSALVVRLRVIQSVLGLAHFVSLGCPPARFLLNSVTDALRGHQNNDLVRLSERAVADLRDLLGFLQQWNGVTFFQPSHLRPLPPLSGDRQRVRVITTDAAVKFGMGGWLDSANARWFFSEPWHASDLSAATAQGTRSVATGVLELRAVLEALRLFGTLCADSLVVCRTDSSAAEADINTGRSQCQPMQELLRVIGHVCMQFRLRLFAMHIPSAHNVFADACSRGLVSLAQLQVLTGDHRLIRVGPSSAAQPVASSGEH